MWGNDADRKHRLEEILQREDHDDLDDSDSNQTTAEDIAKADSAQMDEDLAAAQATAEGFCVECKDQESFYSCEQCAEEFCEVCYGNTTTITNNDCITLLCILLYTHRITKQCIRIYKEHAN